MGSEAPLSGQLDMAAMAGRLVRCFARAPWLVVALAVLALPAEALLCPEMCSGATRDGKSYPCRYYSNNCEIHPTPNPARNATRDLNVLVMLPYTGPIGNTATMAEPLLLAATQEIEDSSMLPGYRLKLHMVDEACSGQIAVHRAIESMNTFPQKHIVLGCDCSASSQPVNHALYHYKIMQVSPFSISVDLSDRDRYPYFSRMAPSYRITVMAAAQVLKTFQVQRVGFVHGTAAIFVGLRDLFREAVQRDKEEGTSQKTNELMSSTFFCWIHCETLHGACYICHKPTSKSAETPKEAPTLGRCSLKQS